MSFSIEKVEGKSGLKTFIKSQWNFYKGDENFVPPVIYDRMKLMNEEKNPFFQHSELQSFLAVRNSEVIGRISAIINHNHNKTHNDKIGFFGFFECVDEQDVADALFREAEQWLKDRGMEASRGPMNPSMNDECGLLIDGFDRPPVILMTYNPEYYRKLIEGAGYDKVKDLFAFLLVNREYVSDKMKRMRDALVKRYDLVVRKIDLKNKKQFRKDVESMKKIYNEAWEPNWGFVKMTDAEFDYLAEDLKTVGDEDYALILESKGKLAGFALGIPDLNQVLIHNKRGTLPGAIYHYLTKKKQIDTLRILVLGILPEFRGKGFDSVLYAEVGERMLPNKLMYGEASWVLEDNDAMIKAATQVMKGTHYKTYRIFERPI